MTTSLTNEEKLNIVNQHIKSVDYSIYGHELDLIQANAVSAPDAGQVSAINARITEANAKKAALVIEKDSLTVTEQEYKMAEKVELVITALQQRIGEIVSNYETQVAILRAEITQMMEEKESKVEAVQDYEKHLNDISAN